MRFDSFEAFAAHLARVAAGVPTVRAAALEDIGAHVEAAAIAKLGDYQAAAGGFAAWAQLAESTLAGKVRREATGGADSPLLVTGEHIRDTIKHKVEGTAAHIGSDDPVAGYQERGTNRIPPRSFLGAALFEQAAWCRHHFMSHIAAHVSGRPHG